MVLGWGLKTKGRSFYMFHVGHDSRWPWWWENPSVATRVARGSWGHVPLDTNAMVAPLLDAGWQGVLQEDTAVALVSMGGVGINVGGGGDGGGGGRRQTEVVVVA